MPCFLEVSHQGSRFRYYLRHAVTTIGRSQVCDLVIQDSLLSRIHCTIARLDLLNHWLFDGEQLIDNRSRNGVYVNSQKVNGSIILTPGDKIKFSRTTMIFKCEYTAEELDKLTSSPR